jgi:hypothetical protein
VGQTAELEWITPVEYSGRKIVRYYGYKLLFADIDELRPLLGEIRYTTTPDIWQEDDMLFYQYPGKPLIMIKDGRFYTTREIWNNRRFTHSQVRHQASVLLRLLHRFNLASYNRKAVPRKNFIPHKYRKKTWLPKASSYRINTSMPVT